MCAGGEGLRAAGGGERVRAEDEVDVVSAVEADEEGV